MWEPTSAELDFSERRFSLGELRLISFAGIAAFTKKAWTIGQLVQKTRNKGTKKRAKNCSVKLLRFEKKKYRWLYRVSCRESYSAPYHICRFKVDSSPTKWQHFNSRAIVHVSCSCPAWVYWGSAYHATQKDFGDLRKENRPPEVRDPSGANFLCKHVIAAAEDFKKSSTPVPPELVREFEEYKEEHAEGIEREESKKEKKERERMEKFEEQLEDV